MITIYDITGTVLYSVMETSPCEKVEELMVSDHIKLSWASRSGDVIPAGSYITYSGERYTLLENYQPTQKSEASWLYEPEFQSSIMGWKKVPFFMYTTIGQSLHRETDWSLTAPAATFLDRIVLAIYTETGVLYTASTDIEKPITLLFTSIDIYSALSAMADAYKTEWWVDKSTNTLHLSKCNRGNSPVTLEVGENINVPTVQSNAEGYYNRFYVYGSNRNIVQDYKGANLNNLINKRLTLNPEDYPDGYYEPSPIPEGGKVFSKILVFDDIYPAATTMEIMSPQKAINYVLDESTRQKIQIGTDDDGNPIYDKFATWYFKVGRRSGDVVTQFFLNAWNYSEDPDVEQGTDGMLIPGLTVSISFTSGSLQGREFELRYIKEHEEHPSIEGDTVEVEEGYFELKYTKEGEYIIPDIDVLKPTNGDKVILFNIRMPDEYIEDAYERLETKMLEEIEEKYTSDQNQYTFASNPVAFNTGNPYLTIGKAVTYVNGDYSFDTRVTKIVTNIARPIIQTITIGNTLKKGAIQEIREDIANANRDINNLTISGNVTGGLAEAYARFQQFNARTINQVQEAINLLEGAIEGFTEGITPVSVNAMALLVGNASNQFKVFDTTFTHELSAFPLTDLSVAACGIKHYTLGITSTDITTPGKQETLDYKHWVMRPVTFTNLSDEKPYFIYAKVPKNGDTGDFIASESSISLEYGNDYYLLCGIMSSALDGNRSFAPLYGYTEILPNQIRTGTITSADGNTYFDLVNGIIGGKIQFASGSSGLENIPEFVDVQTDLEDVQNQLALLNDDSVFDVQEKAYIRTLWENINGIASTTEGSATKGSYAITKNTYAETVLPDENSIFVFNGIVYTHTTQNIVYLYNAAGMTDLDNKYLLLRNYLNSVGLYSSTATFNFDRAVMDRKFTDYYDAEKKVADNVVVGTKNTVDEMSYLHSLLDKDSDVTTIDGGVVLSSIIGVRKFFEIDDENVPLMVAGLNSSSLAEDDEHGVLMLFAGATDYTTYPETEDRVANSKFRVYEDGHVVAEDIEAKGGHIGKFSIGDWLSSSLGEGVNQYNMELSSAKVELSVSNVLYTDFKTESPFDEVPCVFDSTFLANGAVSSLATGHAVTRIESHLDRGFFTGNSAFENIALQLSAHGAADYHAGFLGEIAGGNFALKVLDGVIAGLRPNIRAVTANTTLTDFDHTIVTDQSAAMTITLPASPKNGQEYNIIHKDSGKNLTITCSSPNTIYHMYYGTSSTSQTASDRETLKLNYIASAHLWILQLIYRVQ